MNEEICCITCKGKSEKQPWMNEKTMSSNDDELYTVYKNIRTILFPYLLANLFKERYISSVKSYKYLNKFIS